MEKYYRLKISKIVEIRAKSAEEASAMMQEADDTTTIEDIEEINPTIYQ